jgi:hypothetical protein
MTHPAADRPNAGMDRAQPVIAEGYLRYLLAETLGKVALPDGTGIVLEGSIAEGFGNSSSDIDFLAVVPGDTDLPTMPSVLFVDGRRVEVRTRSRTQLTTQLERAAAAAAADGPGLRKIDEDLLNRCQRFLAGTVVAGGESLERLRILLPYRRFTELMTRWWAEHARQSLRQAIALRALGQHREAAGWAHNGLLQAAKSWVAGRGEGYLETKWLSIQLDRAGETAIVGAYQALETLAGSGLPAERYLVEVLALATELGVDRADGEPERLTVHRVRGVTSWTIGGRTHVVRGATDVFVLSAAAAGAWHSMVFGRRLPDVLRAAPVPDAGTLIADFLRLGLIRLTWQGGGPLRPSLPLCPPVRPITVPPQVCSPVLGIAGGAVVTDRPISLVALPAKRFAAAGLALVWSNVLIENAREDLTGAVKSGQWRVAELTARRILVVALRGVAAAHGVHPLPPDTDLIRFVQASCLGTARLRDAAERLEASVIDSPEHGVRVLDELDRFVGSVREFTGAERFPASFDSGAGWQHTIEIGYDWLRLGANLGCDLPIDEAGDLLATGGHQPHIPGQEAR